MAVQKLTDTKLKTAKPGEKAYTLADGTVSRLYVEVSKIGNKSFRLDFVHEGKEQTHTIGRYPEISLAEAREAALEAKKLISQGIHPLKYKREQRAAQIAASTTFAEVAEKWFASRQSAWSESHVKDTRQKLAAYALKHIGYKPITAIGKADLRQLFDILDAQGKRQTLKKVRGIISQVFQFALDSDMPGVSANVADQIKISAIYGSAPPAKHRATLTKSDDIAGLMKAMASYQEINRITHIALLFSALTFARPGEIRHAEWSEIDVEAKLWRIPAEKMKMKRPHLVPLAEQTIKILAELKPMTGHGKYLFPNERSAERPMSEATVNAALRRLGYSKDQLCAHGLRGTASTVLNEMGFSRDWIELQLAHSDDDKIRASYNHAQYLDDRKKMMQAWADYLFGLTK